MRPARLAEKLAVHFFLEVEISLVQEDFQEVGERTGREVTVNGSPWLAHLRQQPEVFHHSVLCPELLGVSGFRAGEKTAVLQRETSVQVHAVLPCWVWLAASLHISFFLGHHFAQPLGFEIDFCQSLFELLQVALRWEILLKKSAPNLALYWIIRLFQSIANIETGSP